MTVKYRIMRYEGRDEWIATAKEKSMTKFETPAGKFRSIWFDSVPKDLELAFQALTDLERLEVELEKTK